MGTYSESEIKANNFSKARGSFERRELVSAAYPYRLRVEISNICNLRCTFSKEAYGTCPHWSINKTPTLMNPNLFRKIIDEVGIYLTHSELYNYGEPFTHPHAVEMIRYLRKINHDVSIMIHTNGHFLETKEKRIDVINSGLDILSFSVDGITQEVYEKYRIGGNLDAVIDAIQNICRLKKEMGVDKPKIIFQFIVFEHNLQQVPYVEEFAKNLGVDETVLKTDIFTHKPELKISYAHIYNSMLGLQSYDSADNFSKKDKEAINNFCDFPWTYPTVLADGRAVVCCRDGKEESVVGIIGEETLLQVWNGKGYQEFRRKFLEDAIKPYPCNLCECRRKT